MAFSLIITLTSAGVDSGPVFDIYSDVDGFTTPFENDIPKATLLAGYLSINVPDGTTQLKMVSDGVVCTNDVIFQLPITACVYTPIPGVPGGFQIDRNMDDLTRPVPEAYNYQLNDFTINGVNYATGQTLSITDISQVIFGTGLNGITYIMNISDWMTSISTSLGLGFLFYDNMRVIHYPNTVTSYSINITRLGPGGGGPQEYYYSSAYGYAFNSPTSTYGSYTCV